MRPVAVRPAATLVVVRDGEEGAEVCVLRRSARSQFVAGAYVFPGGGVEPEDAGGRWCRDADAAARSDQSLGAPYDAAAHRVAAIRETLEEAGLLVGAVDASGAPAGVAGPDLAGELAAAADGGSAGFAALLERRGWQLTLGALHYVAHWVTPDGAPRRYDTRFYLAAAPEPAPPLRADGSEAVAAEWVRPAELLSRHDAGAAPMLPPTTSMLRWLVANGNDVAALLDAARALTGVPRIEPRVVTDHRGSRRIVAPGEPAGDDGVPRGIAVPPNWPTA